MPAPPPCDICERPADKNGLHVDCKGAFLPLVAAQAEAETGEEVEYVTRYARLHGPPVTLLTTKNLSSFAFSLYIEHVDRLAAEYGCDLSELLDGEDPARYQSGRIEEPDGLDSVPYVEADGGYAVSAPAKAAEMQRTLADLYE